MSEKRFTLQKDYDCDGDWEYCYQDEETGRRFNFADDFCNTDFLELVNAVINDLKKENNELKQHIKGLEKEIYLQHMRSMFSTVKSFKGDVSKRYYYSEKTDTLYDSANNYGQYDKILDKKEIAMLLNEYETLLNGGDLNDRE